jgi:integrase
VLKVIYFIILVEIYSMKVTYYLRKNKSSNEGQIYLQMTTNQGSLRVSTKETIKNADWGEGKPKQKATNKAIEKTLNVLKSNIESFITSTQEKKRRKPTKSELQSEIGRLLGDEKSDLLTHIVDEFIAEFKLKLSRKTIEKKTHHLKDLKDYFGNRTIDDLNKKTIVGYQKRVERMDYEIATLNDYLKTANSFLKWLYASGITIEDFSRYINRIKGSDKQIIALTTEELKIVQGAVMDSDRLQRVLDLFNFALLTGLRYGDLQDLRPKHIIEGRLEMRMVKTGDVVKLKITPRMQAILEKYNYTLPQISNQKANAYLREIFKALKLERMVEISKERMNGIAVEHEKLSDSISFHKARKTFITNALRMGVPASIVMQLSGHKSDEAFKKYIGFVNQDLDDAMDLLSASN